MIRPFVTDDIESVVELLDTSFAPGTYESKLVLLVVDNDEIHHGWIYEENEAVVGFVLFTPAYRVAEMIGWHLAPVAVLPEFQKQGFGSELITHSLNQDPIRGSSVFVLGDPRYYERFGFVPTHSVWCPYDPKGKHFRAFRWREVTEGFTVGYVTAFSEV